MNQTSNQQPPASLADFTIFLCKYVSMASHERREALDMSPTAALHHLRMKFPVVQGIREGMAIDNIAEMRFDPQSAVQGANWLLHHHAASGPDQESPNFDAKAVFAELRQRLDSINTAFEECWARMPPAQCSKEAAAQWFVSGWSMSLAIVSKVGME